MTRGRASGLQVTFANLFMLTRVCLFGYALLSTIHSRLFIEGALPVHVPVYEIDVVLTLLFAGWLLQLHWVSHVYVSGLPEPAL